MCSGIITLQKKAYPLLKIFSVFAGIVLSQGTLRKTRGQRERECHQTKGEIQQNSGNERTTLAAKQQQQKTKFCIVWRK